MEDYLLYAAAGGFKGVFGTIYFRYYLKCREESKSQPIFVNENEYILKQKSIMHKYEKDLEVRINYDKIF